ncbi:nucleotidyl transferase AbiEii/AbiGii toxin family protein [Pseudonocardia sp. DLS-67]
MPLHPLQDLIVRTASALPEAHTVALAGGGAMIAHGFVDRATQDVDLFTEIDDAEARHVTAALRAALRDRGLESRDADRPPADHRFVAVDPADGSECTVEVFADGGRLQPRVMLDVGPVLHPDDLAADKLLALWGRARPRDFYDVHALMRHYTRDTLLHLAAAKDAGFTIETFLDALNAIKRLTDADWAEDGISADAIPQLTSLFAEWHTSLASDG